jgi:hypothetical protein
MMGRRERGPGQFFYAFDLAKIVPADHLVRQIDGVLDLDWVHKELAPYYSHTPRCEADTRLIRIEGIDLTKVKREKFEIAA